MDNWLLLMVIAILFICIVIGYIRGFLKIGIGLLSALITLIIVSFLSPHIADALAKYTPIDDIIEEKCVMTFMPEIPLDDLSSMDLSGTPLAHLGKEDLKKINNKNWEMLGLTTEDVLSALGDIPKEKQIKQIEDSHFPDFIKTRLLENNNAAIYEELGVGNFPNYIASYISRMVLHILSFLVTFVLAIIIVEALMMAVQIIGELPIVETADHIIGGVLGLILALIIIWVVMLTITLAYSTKTGKICFDMIGKSGLLTFLYSHNPILIALLSFH